MEKKLMKKENAITLIALVVTIVVLLILAATSISMLAGENGIITQAQDAKLESRAGNVREEVELWRTENVLRKNNNETQISKETMLTNLKEKGILYEEEIDRQNEIITIGKNEIPYGTEVIINISKTPSTELSGAVILQVTSVEGLGENIQLESEEQYAELLLNRLNSMSNEEREVTYVEVFNHASQAEGSDIHFADFEDLLQDMYTGGTIKEPTKEAFYELIENNGGIESFNEGMAYAVFNFHINLIGEFDYDTKILTAYIISNPANEEKDNYMVTQNGDYTFKVKDCITGKEYNKTINVSNIGENTDYYINNIIIDGEPYGIGIFDKTTNLSSTFEKAFIKYDDELIDITNIIITDDNKSYIYSNDLRDIITNSEIRETYQIFFFQKEGVFYSGEALVTWPI